MGTLFIFFVIPSIYLLMACENSTQKESAQETDDIVVLGEDLATTAGQGNYIEEEIIIRGEVALDVIWWDLQR